jgi:hypothetical protein
LEGREEEGTAERQGAQALLSWVRAFDAELGTFRAGLAQLSAKSARLSEQAALGEGSSEAEKGAAELVAVQVGVPGTFSSKSWRYLLN